VKPELERMLRESSEDFAFPETPAIVDALAPALRAPRGGPWYRARVALIAAVAATVVAAVAATPGARSAVGELIGRLPGLDVERVPELRPFPLDVAPPYLGDRASLESARSQASFTVRVPTRGDLEPPDLVFYRDDVVGGIVTLIYGDELHARLLLTQWRGDLSSADYEVAGPGGRAEGIEVDGRPAVWLEGPTQATYTFVGRDFARHREALRIGANVLLWSDGPVAYRLEGRLTRDEAVAVAESLAP
jgi:hypothetical protein